MIKFFRKIRQKLLSENKFSKYLIYAIGEIILVVLGILIALQINNWNERSKLLKQENEILLLLVEELHDNLGVFDRVSTRNKENLRRVNVYLNNPSAYSHPDSSQNLSTLFEYRSLEINQPILDKILDGSDEIIITQQNLLENLRRLKRSYTSTNKNLSYLDEFWNTNTVSLLISSNLGNHLGYQQQKWNIKYTPGEEFKTTLIMQRALILEYVNSVDDNITRSKEVSKQLQNLSLNDRLR